MRISKDRTSWVTPLGDYYKGKSIFAFNSDVITNTGTSVAIPQSNDKKNVYKQYLESRVVNVSGLIIADTINECKEQERELRSLLYADKLYVYDEDSEKLDGAGFPIQDTGKVYTCSVPNVNNSIKRGEYNGRTALLNFNLTLISPYTEELNKTVVSFSNEETIAVDNSIEDDFAYETPYTIKITANTQSVVKNIFDGLSFTNNISVEAGDVIIISSERQNFTATHNDVSILGNIDNEYFISKYLLQKGVNTFIMEDVKLGFDIEFSFYKRTL